MKATMAWRCRACDDSVKEYLCIIMENIIPLDHVDDLPIVEPNQPDDIPVILDPVLVDEDEDPKEEEFEEEEEPQEEEDDMEVDIEEDENEPELTYPYEEVDPLNPPPPASESEPEDVIEVKDTVEPEDETIPASVYEMTSLSRRLCGRGTTHALVEKKGKAKDEYYGKLILDLGNEVRSSVEEGTTAMENLVRKLGNAKEKAECKKMKNELEEARFSNTLLRMQNERVERDLYWTRVRAHEFYREMIRRGFVFEERPNEAINVLVEDEKNPSSEPRGSPHDSYVNAAIAAERAKHANTGNDARGSRPVRGQDAAPVVRECTFAGFMMCNPIVFRGTDGAVELRRWFEKTESVSGINECAEGKKVKFPAATLQGPALTLWNSKNNQKQGNVRAMTTAPTEGNVSSGLLPVCECCFTRHVSPCTIKCHKCGKVRHKSRYCKEKSVATGANAQPVWTCYNYGEQGHTRNRCPKKVKQEKIGEVRGRAYAIKDAEPQGLNVVAGTFLLNNRYASVLFDSGSDRSFVDTRFSSMLDIDLVKIDASYEVELADGRVVSTNIVLKGGTLNLVNHLFEIDLMPIDLGTFDVIIGIDCLVKHDAVIVCGEKVVRIPYGNKTLTVESDKGID
ncbi:putative reverse transcriptase domain-containing protein [Tanacetum coccineum]